MNNEIINLNQIEAERFFLKQSSYCNFELPPYFEFEKLIQEISNKIKGKKLLDFYSLQKIENKKDRKKDDKKYPNNYDNNNYILFNNKDGKFAWRPLQLIHPVLYVALVNKITEKDNWLLIQNKFKEFRKNSKIECFSLPQESNNDQDSDKASSIKYWLKKIEQQSIDLALEFSSVLHTDITNCYGSIYTHSIEWALHGKKEAKENLKKPTNTRIKFLGSELDNIISNMQYGQTNGLPQGSVLMDFIAEIVLGYVDLELSERLICLDLDYKIIRYRDDYKIFSNNQQDLQIIAKNLTEVLLNVGMRLNDQKTLISNDIIKDSLKPDKFNFIGSKNLGNNLREYLLIIYKLSIDYPNSGALKKSLKKFYDRVLSSKNLFAENIENLISIIVEIAYRNPITYPISFAILSHLLPLLKSDLKENIMKKIVKKFEKIANIGYAEIWLQRVTIKTNFNQKYNEGLCKKVVSNDIKIWECDWLSDDLKCIIEKAEIINKEVIDDLNQSITNDEIALFSSKNLYF